MKNNIGENWLILELYFVPCFVALHGCIKVEKEIITQNDDKKEEFWKGNCEKACILS